MNKKKICILGATGSIGTQALDVIRKSEDLALHSFSYHSNRGLAKKIEEEFSPVKVLCTGDVQTDIASRLEALVSDEEVDIVLHSVTGTEGIRAAITALRKNKKLSLANKETLVSAGNLVMKEDTRLLVPVDSEHSAIYQCLGGSLTGKDLDSIVLTASGGPFRTLTREKIKVMKSSDALKHPNWNMGKKISIDSATMMNKGLEIIEAMHLFSLPLSKIEVLIHPESVIHSMVRFRDGSLLAELSKPDMRQPIQYAFTGRKQMQLERLDFIKLGQMHFYGPDMERFPCLRLALEAGNMGGVMPAVLNAANEVAVDAYIQDAIGFYDIAYIIEKVMDATVNTELENLEQLETTIISARRLASSYVENRVAAGGQRI